MNQSELLQQFKHQFVQMQQELGFKTTFEQLDEVFNFTDYVLHSKFVSPNLSGMLFSRMRDKFNSWTGMLHNWLLPNPSSMISASESTIFNAEEKQQITTIIDYFMEYSSRSMLLSLTDDITEKRKYFDDGIALWVNHKKTLEQLCIRVNTYWFNEAKIKKESFSQGRTF